jgi:hypothetical protein
MASASGTLATPVPQADIRAALDSVKANRVAGNRFFVFMAFWLISLVL